MSETRTKPTTTDKPGMRQRLIEAARLEFSERGIESATTRGIAKRADCNEVTLFRHFESKQKLLAAVVQETSEEKEAGTAKEDVAVTPLAVPMLAGPGAISTVILLHTKADDWRKQVALGGAIVVVCGVSYAVLAISARGMRWLSPIALRVVERVMGLLLAAIAFQFLINALTELKIIPK